jgi:hypothetical protein
MQLPPPPRANSALARTEDISGISIREWYSVNRVCVDIVETYQAEHDCHNQDDADVQNAGALARLASHVPISAFLPKEANMV